MAREVTIYTTPNCSYCKMAKKFLADNGMFHAAAAMIAAISQLTGSTLWEVTEIESCQP